MRGISVLRLLRGFARGVLAILAILGRTLRWAGATLWKLVDYVNIFSDKFLLKP